MFKILLLVVHGIDVRSGSRSLCRTSQVVNTFTGQIPGSQSAYRTTGSSSSKTNAHVCCYVNKWEESCILQGFYLQIHSSMMTYQLAFRTINTLDHLLSNLWRFGSMLYLNHGSIRLLICIHLDLAASGKVGQLHQPFI